MPFLAPERALAVAMMSYNGNVDIGMMGDYDAMADLDEFGEDVRESVAELRRCGSPVRAAEAARERLRRPPDRAAGVLTAGRVLLILALATALYGVAASLYGARLGMARSGDRGVDRPGLGRTPGAAPSMRWRARWPSASCCSSWRSCAPTSPRSWSPRTHPRRRLRSTGRPRSGRPRRARSCSGCCC